MAIFPAADSHRVFMVMGVSGSGKSTLGATFADTLGGRFLDGDDYHPQDNVDHMAKGLPLTDDMRWPWLTLIAEAVNAARQEAEIVFACSALRRSYRNHLRQRIPDMRLIYLNAPRDIVELRLAAREGHFMPPSLLQSQYDALEVPATAWATLHIDLTIPEMIAKLKQGL